MGFKEGDTVRYQKHRYASRGENPHPIIVTKVKKITEAGMIRLEDGTLWYASGKGRGELNKTHLQDWGPETQLYAQIRDARAFIRDYTSRDMEHIHHDDLMMLLGVIKAIQEREVFRKDQSNEVLLTYEEERVCE